MRTAIRKNLADFLAILGVVVLGIGIGAYILSNQRLRFPLVEETPYTVRAELSDAQAVTPGQGQTVVVAGVRVGDIGKVELEEGKAVVELQLERKYEGLLREDASALLRAKTGTKDMFLEVDPGDGKPLPEDGTISVSNTLPDIDPDEFLAALDSDTRDYLKLLISGVGKGLDGRGTDLREVMKRLGPLHRDLARVSRAVADRRHNMRRLINRYGLLMAELGKSDKDVTRLVRASNVTLGAFADEDQNISALVSKLPGTLNETATTLGKVDRLSQQMGPTFESLRAPFRKLDDANAAVLPFAQEAAPILENKVRPFAREAQPFQRDLGAASKDLAQAGPDLTNVVPRVEPALQHRRLQPGRHRGDQCRLRDQGHLHASGARAQRELPLLARLGRPEHGLALLDGGRARPDPARVPAQPQLRRPHRRGQGGRRAGRRGRGPVRPLQRDWGLRQPMIKETPSISRIIAMVAFTLSVFAILIFLWLAFGGSVPLNPEGYRFTVHMPEAATLAQEADVRMSGVNVGKVKSKELDKGGARTIVEVEIDEPYAPIPKDTRAILRAKTLLGETYLELAPGNQSGGMLDDGGRLANAQVEPTVELDEIFTAFDPDTRKAFQDWITELSRRDRGRPRRGPERRLRQLRGLRGRRRQADAGARRAGRGRAPPGHATPGVVFGAINERRGALRELIVNSKRTFEATASRDEALAETFAIFPTFLDESKATHGAPRGLLAQHASARERPEGPGRRPRSDGARPRRPRARPRAAVPRPRPAHPREPDRRAGARADAARGRAAHRGAPHLLPRAQPDPVLLELPPADDRRLHHERRRRPRGRLRDRAARPDPDRHHLRQPQLPGLHVRRRRRPTGCAATPTCSRTPTTARCTSAAIESFNCPGGERKYPEDALKPGQDHDDKRAPCFEVPPSLYDGKLFSYPRKGVAPLRQAPRGNAGSTPARDPDPND